MLRARTDSVQRNRVTDGRDKRFKMLQNLRCAAVSVSIQKQEESEKGWKRDRKMSRESGIQEEGERDREDRKKEGGKEEPGKLER